MKRRDFLRNIVIGGVALGGLKAESLWAAVGETKGVGLRKRDQIDLDWRFHLGDLSNAQDPSFDAQGWRVLDLPHDWSIEGEIREDNPASWHGAYLPGGIGWYRKELTWDPEWAGTRVGLDFDGVFMNSDVWVNGQHLGRRPYGFISFHYDVTAHLRPGVNVIAVRADNSKLPSARWYTGSGIYRHVWLSVTSPVHVGHWGTFVSTPQVSADSASVRIAAQIENESDEGMILTVQQILRNPEGGVAARSERSSRVEARSQIEVVQDMAIARPRLWSPDEPTLYEIETVLVRAQGAVDSYRTSFGVRTLEFSPGTGFKLNGKRTLLKGVCNHHDGGGAVGAAVPDDVLLHRLLQLKEIGCNAFRTAHNPQCPELYAFCNALGLMVLNEAFDGWDKPKGNSKYDYGLYFNEWWERDLESFVRRDRNHPCVIAWSIGNEVGGEHADSLQKKMVELVHRLDSTRPVAEARGYKSPNSSVDIAGFNAEGERKGIISGFHRDRPDKPIVGTEMPHTRQTRGVYRTKSKHPDGGANGDKYPVPDLAPEEVFTGIPKVYSSSYDNDFFSIGVRDQFKQSREFPYLMGSFRWTGHDYLGEANDHWPTRSKDKGIFDLAGIPKDHFFLYQSLWTEQPMVHLLPHWTHPGKEGVKIPIVAYSNCPRVELFFNGTSLGEQKMGEDLQLVWEVPYRPGTLLAVAKSEDRVKRAESTRQTAGAPFAVKIAPDKTTIKADRRAVARLAIAIIDSRGTVVPDAIHRVYFDIKGPGRLIGVDNGDVADLNPTKATHWRNAFHGECMGLIQATDKSGDIFVEARADNLQTGRLRISAV